MAIGNLIMAVSILVLYGITPTIPDTMMWARYAAFVGLYFVWVIGYTFQTSCTRSGQTVLTNDPSSARCSRSSTPSQSAGHGRYAVPGSHPCQKL